MAQSQLTPQELASLVAFGPDANCTVALCGLEHTIYGYRPSMAANIALPVVFGLIGLAHVFVGIRWRSFGFMTGMLLGCVAEIIGYVGRILLNHNPYSFVAFMIQIICITLAPVFFTASIYVTLSKAIVHFDQSLSRIKPKLFYWIFIPFDVACLALQAAGGAMTTEAAEPNGAGVAISKAGLILQVIILVIFLVVFADYIVRYARRAGAGGFDTRAKIFLTGLATSSVLILLRCAYRVAELKDGYSGHIIREEVPFIVLEGVVIVLAAVALFFGHPGVLLGGSQGRKKQAWGSGDSSEMNEF